MVITPWADLRLDGPAPTERPHTAATVPGIAPIVVPAGTSAQITTAPGQQSLVAGDIRFTSDVDEFRDWFAVAGDRFQAGLDPIPPEHLPAGPWTRGSTFAPDELTVEELEALRRAASCYLFGRTALVSEYRDAIEQYYAPFGAAFYRAGRIEVERGASLSVRGYPAVVDIDELVVRQGGQVFIHTPARLAARALTKVA
jgi:hypothetical protein